MLDIRQLNQHIQALEKGDDATRRQALRALRSQEEQEWAAASSKVVHSLVGSLQQQLLTEIKSTFIRQDVVIVLGNLGRHAEAAVPTILELLQEGNPGGIREAAARALGKIGQGGGVDAKVRTALVNHWLAPVHSQNSQVQVAIALCKLGIDAPGLLKYLTTTLVASQDASLRKSAAEALAWRSKNDIDVVPALLTSALHDKEEEVQKIAETSLAQLRLTREKAVQLCSKQLKDSTYAEAALRNAGQLAVPALIDALGADDPTSREKAARILGNLGELAAKAAPALTTALHDKNMDVRLAAAKGLWLISKNAEVVVPVLVELLSEKWVVAVDDSETRRRNLQTVMEALRRIGPPAQGATSALLAMAKDKNRLISESAVSALKEIAPAAAAKAGMK